MIATAGHNPFTCETNSTGTTHKAQINIALLRARFTFQPCLRRLEESHPPPTLPKSVVIAGYWSRAECDLERCSVVRLLAPHHHQAVGSFTSDGPFAQPAAQVFRTRSSQTIPQVS